MSMPRYSRHVVGPSRLSSASGTPGQRREKRESASGRNIALCRVFPRRRSRPGSGGWG